MSIRRTRILFFTFSRSDYASTAPVFKHIKQDERFDPVMVAGGSHLLERFGKSIEDLSVDGIEVTHCTDFLREGDSSPSEISKAFVRLCGDLVEIIEKELPDIVFVLGDRWEMLGVASVAKLFNLPIVHHSGGDLTQGSADNQTRYAISTQAHLHLTAHEEHSERLRAVGEEDWRVLTVGEPALTHLEDFRPISPERFRARFDLKADEKFVLATFHPTSFDSVSFSDQIEFFLEALGRITMPTVVTAPNPDVSSYEFFTALQKYAAERESVNLVENLGVDLYYSAMSHAEFMIGNSSSGIWEAPSFGLPVINIGNRQGGRLRAENVIDIDYNLEDLDGAFRTLETDEFLIRANRKANPYIKEHCLSQISDFICRHSANRRLLEKLFVDPLERSPW